METTMTQYSMQQGPYFFLLVLVGFLFYKFIERSYADHKDQMGAIQDTFKSSLDSIVSNFGTRLDKIEGTLEDIRYSNCETNDGKK